jgi:prepilin-type N-terminal cleavage/methylation domain-containing protein
MAHPVESYDGGERPSRRLPPMRPLPPGFSLIELMVVIAMASVLMLIGIPSLLNTLARYKVHSSAQQFEMLGRQARYEAIKLNQPVTLVGDANRNMFYVISGAIPSMPPYSFPDGPGDIPANQRVAVWELPRGVSFSILPVCPVKFCQAFQFNPDGSASGPAPPAPPGQSVTFSTPNQSSSKVSMAFLATGKLIIQ